MWWLHISVKTVKSVEALFKWMNGMVCKLYLHSCVLKKKKRVKYFLKSNIGGEEGEEDIDKAVRGRICSLPLMGTPHPLRSSPGFQCPRGPEAESLPGETQPTGVPTAP